MRFFFRAQGGFRIGMQSQTWANFSTAQGRTNAMTAPARWHSRRHAADDICHLTVGERMNEMRARMGYRYAAIEDAHSISSFARRS